MIAAAVYTFVLMAAVFGLTWYLSETIGAVLELAKIINRKIKERKRQ